MSHTEDLEQANVRLDHIVWIENELANFDATTETFREFCEDLPEEEDDSPLYKSLPCLQQCAEDGSDSEGVTEALYMARVKMGFIFKAAHPVMEWSSDTSASFSWGCYNTAWLYASDIDGVTKAAVAWAETLDAESKAKQSIAA